MRIRRIGGIGFSVGGEMMLQAAASTPGSVPSSPRRRRPLCPRTCSDAAAGSRSEAAVETAAVAVRAKRPPPSLTDLVPRIAPRPLLLIYAGQGGGGEELNPDYYDAASTPKTLWEIPEAGHVGGYQARPHGTKSE